MKVGVVLERLRKWSETRVSELWPFGHCDRDQAVELNHRRRGDAHQRAVQARDPRPVRGLSVNGQRVLGRDRRLDEIPAWLGVPGRLVQLGQAEPDRGFVPAASVLIAEQDRFAVLVYTSRAS